MAHRHGTPLQSLTAPRTGRVHGGIDVARPLVGDRPRPTRRRRRLEPRRRRMDLLDRRAVRRRTAAPVRARASGLRRTVRVHPKAAAGFGGGRDGRGRGAEVPLLEVRLALKLYEVSLGVIEFVDVLGLRHRPRQIHRGQGEAPGVVGEAAGPSRRRPSLLLSLLLLLLILSPSEYGRRRPPLNVHHSEVRAYYLVRA